MTSSINNASLPAHLPRRKSRILLWVALAFVVQIAAWTAWFVIAANHKVAEVPLTTAR